MYFLIQRKSDSMYFADPEKCERTFTPYIREAAWFSTQGQAERVRDGLHKHDDYRVLETSFRTVS